MGNKKKKIFLIFSTGNFLKEKKINSIFYLSQGYIPLHRISLLNELDKLVQH
jgi:hypothetical protein